jgi:transcriptional regulator GlxA family with amidase domain
MNYSVFIDDGVEPIDIGAASVVADFGFDHIKPFDVLVVTGGPGWTAVAKDPTVLQSLKGLPSHVKVVSLCTGAMILAAAGLLDGCRATTKKAVWASEESPLHLLKLLHPAVAANEAVAVHSKGILTAGGVTLGIDGMLYLLCLLHGEQVAGETAGLMEYGRAMTANAAAAPLSGC